MYAGTMEDTALSGRQLITWSKNRTMLLDNRILGIIPARGGSKGIPKKNIFPVNHKPLIYYSISEALKSAYIDRLIVTTDDDEIAAISKKYGAEVPFVRPANISSDTSSSEEVIAHTLNWVKENGQGEFDYFILLQPTSPLRRRLHIDEAIEKIVQNKPVTSLISISPVKEHPYLMKRITEEGALTGYTQGFAKNPRRQDLPQLYYPNGAIYISRVEPFLSTMSLTDGLTTYYLMEKKYSIDIDDYLDVRIAEIMLESENPHLPKK